MIHRDIRPDHVVILEGETGEGFEIILDLGIAATPEQAEFEVDPLYGTPAYMAPEQIAGTRIDGRADPYAMGIMLYLVGEVPFTAARPSSFSRSSSQRNHRAFPT